MAGDNPTAHILQSLVMNSVICATKGVAAYFTGSGALLAETLHTGADCGNQLLLLLGVSQSRRPPDAAHPLGYGRALYFWSFIVALILFTGGGVFSIYEGMHKLEEPEPISLVFVGLGILLFSLVLEGYATLSNIKEMSKRRGQTPFIRYIRETKDSDLVVVFGENAAATLGLIIAFASLVLAWITGDSRYDAIGSIGIGIVLVLVAIFLAIEVKSLLVGECADKKIEQAIQKVVGEIAGIERLIHVITVQQGPGQVLVMMKLSFAADLNINKAGELINVLEVKLRELCPEVKWCFVEPDRYRQSAASA